MTDDLWYGVSLPSQWDIISHCTNTISPFFPPCFSFSSLYVAPLSFFLFFFCLEIFFSSTASARNHRFLSIHLSSLSTRESPLPWQQCHIIMHLLRWEKNVLSSPWGWIARRTVCRTLTQNMSALIHICQRFFKWTRSNSESFWENIAHDSHCNITNRGWGLLSQSLGESEKWNGRN